MKSRCGPPRHFWPLIAAIIARMEVLQRQLFKIERIPPSRDAQQKEEWKK